MKLISITNTETSVLSLWIRQALVEGENEEMVLVVFGSELMDQITTILLQEGVSVIEEKSLQSEFKGGRRSKVNTSQSPPEHVLSLKKFHSPNIRLTAAVISKNYSLNNLSQLPELKKQVIEPLLSLLSLTSTVIVINSSETMALGTIVMLALTHPHVQYTAECTTPLSIFQPKEGEFEVVFAGQGDSVSSTLTGKALEAKIQEMLTSVPTITSFSEASLFFLRKIIFAIIKERDHKRSIQTFQNDIITQLTDSTQTKEDGSDRKRKYEQVSEFGELENTRKVGKIRSVKSLPSIEDGLSVFEFFSGIGGMRLALPKEIRGIPIKHITAFDINRIANQFYQYNFHERKIDGIQDSQLKTCVIEALKAEDVDGKCDIWTMSPPCQPFTTTRGANRKDHLDNRSKGLYHIMLLLLTIQKLPRWIVLENVKGFVNSEMYTLWLQVIRSCGYEFEEYLLSPETAVGIPNARKRYYFIAELKDSTTVDSLENRDSSVLSNNQLLDELGQGEDRPDTEDDADKSSNAMKDDEGMKENDDNHEDEEESGEAGLKSEAVPTTFTSSTVYLNEHVKTQLPLDVQRLFSLSKNPSSSNEAITLREIIQRRINENDWLRFNTMPELIVPLNILQASWAKKHLSIADLDSQLTYCFTKGYGKIYDHSAGSCLFIPSLTSQSTAKEIDRQQLINYHQMIRLFHPEELLVLFGFPNDYSFPSITSSLTLSHQYGCIGNSVNVTVVKAVMHRLFQ